MYNTKQRKYINKKYVDWIRQLPCSVCGIKNDIVHPHHISLISNKQIRNDLFIIPLSAKYHVPNGQHVTNSKLREFLKEDPIDRCIFYHGLYFDYLQGTYDPAYDEVNSFYDLRMRLEGKM